jgi:acetyl-CoA acetyltransferase
MTGLGKFAIVGYGETPVSRGRTEKGEKRLSEEEYFAWAAKLAIEDAGLEKKDLDGQGIGVVGSSYPHAEIWSAEVVQNLGFRPHLMIRSDHGGMGGASLLYQAGLAVTSGVVNYVLCIGADTPMNISEPGAVRTWRYESDFQKPFGMMGPNSQIAFVQRRHMYEYGTNVEDLGRIAVSQRKNATRNPLAYMRTPLSLEEYLSSRMIADPVRLFDACIPVNGGLSFLVTSLEMAKKASHRNAVPILAIAESDNLLQGSSTRPDICSLGGLRESSKKAFQLAGIKTEEISFFQPYDDYTIIVLMQIEDVGFCEKGKAGQFLRDHDISYEGDFPINTGGGQLSSGQPAMAGGFIPIVESVRQLRGEGGDRQIKSPKIGVATGLGALSYGNNLCNSATIVFGPSS